MKPCKLARFHLAKNLFCGSTADTIQQAIFELFDCLEAEKPKDFYSFAIERLGQIKWEEGQAHLAAQTEQIAREIFEIYRADPDFCGNNLKNKLIDPKLKDMKRDGLSLDNF